jgi:hypothetical protein
MDASAPRDLLRLVFVGKVLMRLSDVGFRPAQDTNAPPRNKPDFGVEGAPGVDEDRVGSHCGKRGGINSSVIGPLSEM